MIKNSNHKLTCTHDCDENSQDNKQAQEKDLEGQSRLRSPIGSLSALLSTLLYENNGLHMDHQYHSVYTCFVDSHAWKPFALNVTFISTPMADDVEDPEHDL
uniref:Uncharacterized protein n=1 Tax=Romanomermis culicivorax TaxID=13658 RepID=A0A915JU00_ROMCU